MQLPLSLLLLTIITTAAAALPNPFKLRRQDTTTTTKNDSPALTLAASTDRPAQVVLPSNYNDAGNEEKRYPAFVVLHGWGSSGECVRGFVLDGFGWFGVDALIGRFSCRFNLTALHPHTYPPTHQLINPPTHPSIHTPTNHLNQGNYHDFFLGISERRDQHGGFVTILPNGTMDPKVI
jgi:hypothetical protein